MPPKFSLSETATGVVVVNMTPFSGSKYSENEERCTEGDEACVLCGKAVSNPKEAPAAEVYDGGAKFVLEGETTDTSDPGYMGCYVVGPTCARKLRKVGVALQIQQQPPTTGV